MAQTWTKEMKDYIVSCYQGTARSPASGAQQRWFAWEGGHEGHVREFVLHLEVKFGVTLPPHAHHYIHYILRERGHPLFSAPHPSPTPSTKGRTREHVEEEAAAGREDLSKVAPLLAEAASTVFRVAVALEVLSDKVSALEKTLTHLQETIGE